MSTLLSVTQRTGNTVRSFITGTERRKNLTAHILFAVSIFIVWHVAHQFMPRAVPTWFQIADAFWLQVTQDQLLPATYDALYAIFAGFFLAVVFGIPLGLAMGLNQLFEEAFDPYLNALYVTPFAALVPALIMWFGTGITVRTVVVFFFALFPITINTLEGAKTVPAGLMEVTESFCAGRLYTIRMLVLPYEVPYIVSGLRMGLGRAVKGLVIVELLVAVTGFGAIITAWSSAYRMEGVYSVVIVLMLLGILFTWILRRLESRFIHWNTADV